MTDTELIERLKAGQPKKLRVYDVDDTMRDVAIANHRRKWSAAAATLASYAWTRIELLDGKNAVVGVIERGTTPATGIEDLATSPGGRAAEVNAQVAGLLSLMLKAQDVALDRQQRMMSAVLDQQASLLRIVATRLTDAERARSEDMRAIRELTLAVADAEADAAEAAASQGQSGDALIKLVPAVIGALRNGPQRRRPQGSPPGANGKRDGD
jgi:hypothetical protein